MPKVHWAIGHWALGYWAIGLLGYWAIGQKMIPQSYSLIVKVSATPPHYNSGTSLARLETGKARLGWWERARLV